MFLKTVLNRDLERFELITLPPYYNYRTIVYYNEYNTL